MKEKTELFLEGRELAERLASALNRMSGEKEVIDGFLEGLSGTHRTLQQNFGNLLIASIRHLAEAKKRGWYDLRNEATVNLCEKLAEVVEAETHGADRLPFI
jgi:hypothetical protein